MKIIANNYLRSLLVMTALIAGLAGGAFGQLFYWTGGGCDYDWDNPFNWSIGAVPDGGQTEIIDSTVIAYRGIILDDQANLLVSDSSLTTTDLLAGARGQGSADINNSTLEAGGGVAGLFYESEGDIRYENAEVIYANDMAAGVAARGTIRVGPGTSVTSDTGLIGYGPGGEGAVFLESPDAKWTITGGLALGLTGQGELTVRLGGVVTCESILLSSRMTPADAPGSGSILVADNGRLACPGDMYVAEHGQAVVTVADGGSLSVGDCRLGFHQARTDEDGTEIPAAFGEIVLTGSAAEMRCESLVVGDYGRGRVVVGPDCRVDVDDRLYLAYRLSSEGVLQLNGGRLSTKRLYLGGDSVWGGISASSEIGLLRRDGAIEITDPRSELVVTREFRIGETSRLTADGGRIVLAGASLVNNSTTPADLNGLANVEVVVESPNGEEPTIEAAAPDAGPTVDNFDNRFAFGILRIGQGRVKLVDEIDNTPEAPQPDAVYVEHLILAAGTTLDLNGLALNCRRLTDEGGTIVGDGVLGVSRFPGDINGDGQVDLQDFIVLKTRFGSSPADWSDGDLNDDGCVDLDDFVILKANFGRSILQD